MKYLDYIKQMYLETLGKRQSVTMYCCIYIVIFRG